MKFIKHLNQKIISLSFKNIHISYHLTKMIRKNYSESILVCQLFGSMTFYSKHIFNELVLKVVSLSSFRRQIKIHSQSYDDEVCCVLIVIRVYE